MKLFLFCSVMLLAAFHATAQTPDDALRSSWFIPGGTARAMGVGGAMGSLGGDITASSVNPAGVGLIRTKEIIISPGFMFNNNSANFRGTNSSANKSAFAYGATGFVLGGPTHGNSTFNSFTFAFSVNQLASYNNHVHYEGENSLSSYSEKYLEELSRDNASPSAALSNYIFGSSLAYYTYLIDTTINNGQLVYFGLPNPTTGLKQVYDEVTSGSYNEVSFTFAGGINDKLFVGGSLDIPIVDYRRDITFTESDASGNTNNNFDYSTYTENYRSSGIGLGFKIGIIYKPQNNFRVGFALHSPSFIWYTDKIRAAMVTSTEGYTNDPNYPNGIINASSDDFNDGNPGLSKYQVQTPIKAVASATYLFSAVADTKKQRGFITADVEYTGYGGSKFLASDPENDPNGSDYYNSLNEVNSDYLKGNINVRLGGELKFDPLSFRLGGGYYGSPYRDTQLKASRLQLGGGVGYRNHGLSVDLTYVQTFNKDVNFPYRLNDKPNTFATTNDNRGNVILTLGFKI